MRTPYEPNLLLGALLERLGNAQAQTLLARLDRWLSRDDPDAPSADNRFDRDQFRSIEASYDRRKKPRTEYTT